MARYDFGLRGPSDTQDPRYHDWSRASRRESEHPQRRVEDQEGDPRIQRGYSRPVGDRYPRTSYRDAADGADLSGRIPDDQGAEHRDARRSRYR